MESMSFEWNGSGSDPMNAWKSFSVSAATVLSMMLSATASAEVEVRFLHPERYADAGA